MIFLNWILTQIQKVFKYFGVLQLSTLYFTTYLNYWPLENSNWQHFLQFLEHLTLSGNIVYDVNDHLPNFLIIQKFTSLPINVKNCKQFGFCAKHSTDHAILSIIDLIQYAIDYQEFSCGIYLDFSKAFDIVNHNIMIEK